MAIQTDLLQLDSAKQLGIIISKIAPHTKITIKTLHSSYQLEILEDQNALITGGNLGNGRLRFEKPTEIRIKGSSVGGSMIKMDWLGQNMRLEFTDLATNSAISTSPILDAVVEAADSSWSYCMDWQITQTKCTLPHPI